MLIYYLLLNTNNLPSTEQAIKARQNKISLFLSFFVVF